MFTEAKCFSLFTLFQRCCMMKKDGNKFLGVVPTQNIFTLLSRCYTTTLSQQRLWCTAQPAHQQHMKAVWSLDTPAPACNMQFTVYNTQISTLQIHCKLLRRFCIQRRYSLLFSFKVLKKESKRLKVLNVICLLKHSFIRSLLQSSVHIAEW